MLEDERILKQELKDPYNAMPKTLKILENMFKKYNDNKFEFTNEEKEILKFHKDN